MRKIATLALALIMALSLAAPALAFTDVTYDPVAESGITLDIKLVDVGQGFFSGSFTAPPSNRGYAKNEVVCAVVSMFVPKGVDPDADYDKLVFSGRNVSLWQEDNFRAATYGGSTGAAFLNAATATGGGVGMLQHVSGNFAGLVNNAMTTVTLVPESVVGYGPFSYATNMSVDNEIILEFKIAHQSTGAAVTSPVAIFPTSPATDATYQFAIFGKVTADDAEMVATLKGTGALVNAATTGGAKPTIASTLNMIAIGDYYVGYYNQNIAGALNKANGASTGAAMSALADVTSAAQKKFVISATSTDIVYIVSTDDAAAEPVFAIVTDKNYNCKAMYVYDTSYATVYQITPALSNNAFAVYVPAWDAYVQFTYDDTGLTMLDPVADAADVADLLPTISKDIFGEFGLNVTKTGQMKPDWWAGNKTLSDSVKIEPWYAEVTVPPEIEIEIPKTGDALSVMGFVLVALAGLAVVAVRKVKA